MPHTSKDETDHDVMVENIMKATGLSRELAQEVLCADAELDSQCDKALADAREETEKGAAQLPSSNAAGPGAAGPGVPA